MIKFTLYVMILLFISVGVSYGDTNFNLPSQCTQGATGAASSDLATAGDPPIVEVYRNSGWTSYRYADITSIKSDSSKNWYVQFDAPQYDTYNIRTVYTAFLTSYQSANFYKGSSGLVALAQPGSSILNKTYTYFNLALGSMLGNAYVEFSPDIAADDPFTMQVDENGNLTIYCYTSFPLGQPITVYDSEHVFYNTGTLYSDGSIKWSSTDGE